MHKLTILLLSAALLMSSQSYAMDALQIMRQRPSYINLYMACSRNIENFKEDMYIKVYQKSMKHTAIAMSLSGKEIAESFHSGGITPGLSRFLNQEVTSYALKDCFKNEDVHYAFIRNLIIIDSVGKAVGISIGVISYRFFGKFLKTILFKPIEAISPKLAGKLGQLTFGTLLATQLYLSKDEYLKLFSNDELIDETRAEAVNKIIKDNSDSLSVKAQDQIYKIELALKNQNLTTKQKDYLLSELKKWKIILREFS